MDPGLRRDERWWVAADAEKNCPVSKVLNAEITMTATLK